MPFAKISPAQATSIVLARRHANDTDRKAVKKEIFTQLRAQFGITSDIKLKVEVDNPSSPDYLVLKNKVTDARFDLASDDRVVGAPAVLVSAMTRNRFFKVDASTAKDLLRDDVFNSGIEFADGADVLPTDSRQIQDGVHAAPNGDIYVQLSEQEI